MGVCAYSGVLKVGGSHLKRPQKGCILCTKAAKNLYVHCTSLHRDNIDNIEIATVFKLALKVTGMKLCALLLI